MSGEFYTQMAQESADKTNDISLVAIDNISGNDLHDVGKRLTRFGKAENTGFSGRSAPSARSCLVRLSYTPKPVDKLHKS